MTLILLDTGDTQADVPSVLADMSKGTVELASSNGNTHVGVLILGIAEVWLAEKHECGAPELLGLFSTPEKAEKVCQDRANQYFGPKTTPALDWRPANDGGYRSAGYQHPCGGYWLFQVTKLAVDEELEDRS